MGDDDQRRSLLVQLRKEIQHDVLVGFVQIAGGFIRKDELRMVDQRPGDADALLLAAGKLAGQMPRALPQTYASKRFQRFLFVRYGMVILAHHDVFYGGQVVHHVELLEDQPDFIPADVREALAALFGDIHAVQQHLALGGLIHAADNVHHRRFAGA